MGSTGNMGASATMGADGVLNTVAPVEKTSIPSTSSFPGSTFAGVGSLLQGLSGLGAAYSQAQAARIQGEYQAQQYEFNQKMDAIGEQDALFQGNVQAENENKQVDALVGKEVASYAASGVSALSGSAATVENQTRTMGTLSVMNIKNNAWRTALGYQVQGMNNQAAGGMAAIGGNLASSQTLLTGGLQVAAGLFQSGYYFGGGSGNLTRTNVSGRYAMPGGPADLNVGGQYGWGGYSGF